MVAYEGRSHKELHGGSSVDFETIPHWRNFESKQRDTIRDIYICLISLKRGPLSFRLAPGAAGLQASPVSKKVGGLPSWSVQLSSPGTALTVGGWITPWGQN